jgi:AcrR family transcriptional regulator
MPPRKKNPREHILETAGRLFYRDGIRTVGVDRILVEADVAKATLYRHFPTKEHLVAASLEARHERVIATMIEGAKAAAGTARHPVLALFDMLAAKSADADFQGCAFLLAIAQQRESKMVRDIAVAHKSAVRGLFRELLQDEVDNPYLVAEQLSLIYDGALAAVMVQGKDGGQAAGKLAASVLNSAPPAQRADSARPTGPGAGRKKPSPDRGHS